MDASPPSGRSTAQPEPAQPPDTGHALLDDAGVLYAPDYVINAGGVIQVADELHPDGYSHERAQARAAGIGPRLREIFALAREQRIAAAAAADRFAEQRMAGVGGLRRFWLQR